MRKICLLLLFVIVQNGIFAGPEPKKKESKKPKKVIFLIGDGMGLAQITAAMANYQGRNAFERFPVIGLSKTSSSDNYVTDSGAGATVFSIGKKTFNGAIGVDSLGKEQDGLFEKLKRNNWGTGVIATSSITHATPASFYAHVASRKSEEDIASYLLRNNCDIAVGGGTKFIQNRKDQKNLIAELLASGFYVSTDSTLQNIDAKKYIQTLSPNGMKTMQEGRGNYLERATQMACNNLTKYHGKYFLMVEGSQIDWGGHDNNFEYMKAELLDFNEVINMVLDEAMRDGNTLVVVTADHETGGLSLLENKNNKLTFTPNYATGSHSGIMVPVFAYGPGAELFAGIYPNTEIYEKFLQLMNLNGISKTRK